MAAKELNGSKGTGADKAKDIVPFGMNMLQPVEMTNVRHRLNALLGVEPEHLEESARWSVVSAKLRSFDVVEVVGFGGRWFAEVLVIDAQRGMAARVKLLRSVRLDAPGAVQQLEVPAGHEIRFDPQSTTYTGYRTADNVPMTPPQSRWIDAHSLLVNHATLRGN